MKVIHENNRTLITGIEFTPAQVLDCGQAFRWIPYESGYIGVVGDQALHCDTADGAVILFPSNEADWNRVWKRYFDFGNDYESYKTLLRADEHVAQGVAFAEGLRLLNQAPFETLISFIISANNNVKRIRGIIERICARYGDAFTQSAFPGRTFYAFPSPEQLAAATVDELSALGAGYRAPYIADTARTIAGGYDLSIIADMPYAEAKEALCAFKGVGPKVADCVLLFAFGCGEAFPLDVWVKRVMREAYGIQNPTDANIRAFVKERFGGLAGLAQQYLFYYARSNI